MAKVKAQPGVKAGKKAAYQTKPITDGPSDLDKWEETLTGYRDNVSEENEQQAHAILADLCAARRKDTDEARRHLDEARAILERCSDDEDRKGCELSFAFVKQLLDEEEAVLDLVAQAARDQVEW